jgi:nucleotidyltransferase/DNA polymerase involved in DNA repair
MVRTKRETPVRVVDATRALGDLVSVGPATLADLARLGISDVAALEAVDPEDLYDRIGVLDGARHDPCALDVFRAAVAQARDPDLPAEQRQWWYWSRLRKAGRRSVP